MELPPEHNSFRRLLAYRIAQRFGLTHAVSDQINEVIVKRHIVFPAILAMPLFRCQDDMLLSAL